MGLFDLPAPLFGAVDGLLASFMPALARILLWGVLAGWLTMVLYRALSNQEKISALKAEQREHQKSIAAFDGEFDELLPLIGQALRAGLRQLGSSLGPALLATIPILFIVVWVAGEFGYRQPAPYSAVAVELEPADADRGGLRWLSETPVEETASGWSLTWPADGGRSVLRQGGNTLLELPGEHDVPVIHKRRWWNWLMANPQGYLEDSAPVDAIHVALPAQQFSAFGPDWTRGWMFFFFGSLLLSSLAFKLLLRIE